MAEYNHETGRPAPPRAPAEAETPEAVWTVRRAPEEERAVDEETAPVTETVDSLFRALMA